LISTDVCYKSFLYGVQLAIHFMRKNDPPGGKVVATSTIASLHPHQTFPEYCGAKAAVSPNVDLESMAVAHGNQINQFVRTAAPILKSVSKLQNAVDLPLTRYRKRT
jgi:NAD(P)-dependent dehydrogenase (short-subunit alcohol dehydrogenase family)